MVTASPLAEAGGRRGRNQFQQQWSGNRGGGGNHEIRRIEANVNHIPNPDPGSNNVRIKVNVNRVSAASSGSDMGVSGSEETVRFEPLNVTVIMLNRRTALLQWWPENALMHRDVEIVFTPEYSK